MIPNYLCMKFCLNYHMNIYYLIYIKYSIFKTVKLLKLIKLTKWQMITIQWIVMEILLI